MGRQRAGEVVILNDYREARAAAQKRVTAPASREYMALLPDGSVRVQLYSDDPERALELLEACNRLQSALLRLVAAKKTGSF